MSRPTVTAVIPHWYEERGAALKEALFALQRGTVVPDETLVWDNTGRLTEGTDTFWNARVIRSPRNIGPKARFLAALMAETDYVFFQDNDMVVEAGTIENLLGDPAVIATLEGRCVARKSPTAYRHWPKIHGHGIPPNGYRAVTISLGRAEMVARHVLPEILSRFPWQATTVFDDLWFSWCAKKAHVPIHVIGSVRGESDLRDIHTHVGLCTEPDYYTRRDQVAQQLFCEGPQS